MFLKIFFLLIVFLNLKLPLNGILDVLLLFFAIFILYFVDETKLNNIKYNSKFYLIIFFLTIFNLFIPKFFIEELHQVFLNKNDLKIISEIFPENINKNLKLDFDNNFDSARLIKSHGWNDKQVQSRNFIKSKFAYSVDSFFQKNKFSRINSKLNFSSREELRIGKINSLDYNLPYDKQFRRILPYVVLFELDKRFDGSKICHKGNVFFAQNDKKVFLNDIKILDFIKQKQESCAKLNFNQKYFYLLGYSINEKDNLIIKTDYNNEVLLLKFLNYFLTTLIIIVFGYAHLKKNTSIHPIIYLVSSISTVILTFVRDPNLLFGLRFYRGGADGLLHYSYGRDIVENLNNYNFFEAFKGGEEIFYFMPGLRYFSSLNNIIFGDTAYGYLISCTFIPLLIYLIFEKLINKKIAIILFSSFIFLPIFENMGFGFFNYIWQFARNHAETLSITIILLSLYKISEKNFIQKLNITTIFLCCFLLSISVICRPNFLPTTTLIFIYFLIFGYSKNYKLAIAAIFGYSFTSLSLIHNLYFGNKFILFTESSVHFAINEISQKLNFTEDDNIIFSQLSRWNPLYNLHRLIILLFIFYSFIKNKKNSFIWLMISCIFFQHLVLLLTHPDSRYAYLAWLLTFILFVYYLFNFNLKKLK